MAIRLADSTREAYPYPLLIKQLLHTSIATASEQEIVYRDRSRYSYGTFHGRLGRLANVLESLGAGSRTVVAVMDWDSHRYLECYFAVPMMGAVLQTVNVRLPPRQVLLSLCDTRAEVILVHRDFVPLLAGIFAQLEGIKAVVLLEDEPSGEPLPQWVRGEYESLMAAASGGHAFEDFDERALATVFHTTGTSGRPKPVCFSHRQIVLLALAGAAALGGSAHGQALRHDDIYMPMTPMFHVHAWAVPYVATLMGLKQVYPGRYIPEELIALRLRERVTFSHCVPTILQMLLKAARRSEDLDGWKIIIGGAMLPPAMAGEALRAGIDIFCGYGMSETGPSLTISRLPEPSSRLSQRSEIEARCCAGVPLPLVDLRIVDGEGRAVAAGSPEAGEIVVRAPWATGGYLGDPQASARLWQGGYLHTQDIGTIDRQGRLRITDRIKDVIKSGGEWVSSLELEALFASHPDVLEAAVLGVPDVQWGERPIALIVPRGAEHADLVAELQGLVEQHVASGALSKYAVPNRILLVQSLQKTGVGKIDKRALRERYGS
jgi:fatty-acyl-CoA synthase